MTDGVIKGTGNSRYLKTVSNALTAYPTYADFLAALVAGTLPVDLNGINEAGWTTLPTWLSKENLLTDETAAALDLSGGQTVAQALATLAAFRAEAGAQLVGVGNCKIETATYVGTGSSNGTHTITFSAPPLLVLITHPFQAAVAICTQGASYGAVITPSESSSPIAQLLTTWSGNSLTTKGVSSKITQAMDNVNNIFTCIAFIKADG